MWLDIFNRKKYIGEKCVLFLKKRITTQMSLEQLIAVFEEMCKISVKEEMILFETGVFKFSGKPLFYFSLVRQYPNGDEEYYQIHMDVRYQPNEENEKLNESVWNEDINQNMFEYIRNSDVFQVLKGKSFVDVDIYLDET